VGIDAHGDKIGFVDIETDETIGRQHETLLEEKVFLWACSFLGWVSHTQTSFPEDRGISG
jgi:hypothetical protein